MTKPTKYNPMKNETIRQAIINYIDRKRETIPIPCKHDYKEIARSECSHRLNPNFNWLQFTYFCPKCCDSKVISTKE